VRSIQRVFYVLCTQRMKHILTFLAVAWSSLAFAQEPDLDWVSTFGGSSAEAVAAIEIGPLGEVYTVGTFTGTVDFNPGVAVHNLTTNGGKDIYISKLDKHGNFIWARHMGSPVNDFGLCLAVDDSGNVYTSGFFRETADFDPGIDSFFLTSVGNTEIFLSKLDSSGAFQWAHSFGDSAGDMGFDVDITPGGNVLLTGQFWHSVDFDPDTSTHVLTALSGGDMFLGSYLPGGGLDWAKAFPSATSYARPNHLTQDDSANIYITGLFHGQVDFDPDTATYELASAGQADAFVAKYDSVGNLYWAQRWGSSALDLAYASAIDQQGNVFVTGDFAGYADFDPSTGTDYHSSAGGTDGFLTRFNWAGDFLGAVTWGGTQDDRSEGIGIDPWNGVYVCGWFLGSADFDPGTGTTSLTSFGGRDAYVSKFDTSLSFQWVQRFGDVNHVYCYDMFTDSANIYTCGGFLDSCDFDPDTSDYYKTSVGLADAFVHKLQGCNTPSFSNISLYTCDTVVSPSGNYVWNESGTYNDVVENVSGCDSFIAASVTVYPIDSSIDTHEVCGGLMWIDSIFYAQSNNTATITLSNSNGCDSLVFLDLTVNPSFYTTDSITSCDSATWIDGNTYYANNNTALAPFASSAGCDSVHTLALTINYTTSADDVQVACDSFTWIDSNTYHSNNNSAVHIVEYASGCDSIITLDLTINAVDTSISISGATLTSSQSGGTYQWLNCDSGMVAITSATFQMFTASQNGSYALVVGSDGCFDTTACNQVVGLGVSDQNAQNVFSIYPNPTSGSIEIRSLHSFDAYQIHDLAGRLLQRGEIASSNLNIVLPTGLYVLSVVDNMGETFSELLVIDRF